MASSCELLDAELALDRVEAELARDLPAHVRAFAAAYAVGQPEPPAPPVLARPATIETGRRALAHPLLADRGLALLRLAVPVALHATGETYRAMCAARDAKAQKLGMSALEVTHRIQGSHPTFTTSDREPRETRSADAGEVVNVGCAPPLAWRALAAKHAVSANVTFVASAQRARTFVVTADEHIVIVPARVDSLAARFAVMHELGHVLAACLSPLGIPRALDEAVAALAAMSDEPGAIAARVRRLARARELDAIERGNAPPPAEIPWSLWHDPGAQAAYVLAEQLADELAGAADLRAAIAAQRDRIDRAFHL